MKAYGKCGSKGRVRKKLEWSHEEGICEAESAINNFSMSSLEGDYK